VEKHNRSNAAAKELLLAEMVYRTAVEKHRTEKTEVSRRVVAQAYQQFLETQRDVMVASWDPNTAELVPCPRCKKPTLAKYWQRSPPLPAGTVAKIRRPQRVVPNWATELANRGADRVTSYGCDNCGFSLSLVT